MNIFSTAWWIALWRKLRQRSQQLASLKINFGDNTMATPAVLQIGQSVHARYVAYDNSTPPKVMPGPLPPPPAGQQAVTITNPSNACQYTEDADHQGGVFKALAGGVCAVTIRAGAFSSGNSITVQTPPPPPPPAPVLASIAVEFDNPTG